MLLLDRRISNSILIGEDVEIVVAGFYTDANGQQAVKLGINAPKHVSIDRKEVRERRIKNVDRMLHSGIPKK